jgi:hypothetical protein
MSKIEVNTVAPQCGTTLTLGESGDTVTLASGASQSGFGRTGTVDWQTTIKTGDFTAANGEGYFINTTSGAVTMTLPSSPSVGDIVAFKDYANTFDTNALTLGRNGSNISGEAADAVISVEGQSVTLVYGDATKGWQGVAAATEADVPKPTFISASGGTISCSGDDRIHTFTGPGTFTVNCASNTASNNVVSYVIVGGGGGAGGFYGGGGAGGYREVKSPATPYTASPLCGHGTPANIVTVTAQAYPIVVGGGGAAASPGTNDGTPGNNSSFGGITAALGGHGSGVSGPGSAGPGGSGGGEGYLANAPGNGNTPPTTPPQGNNGGAASPVGGGGGGGGGATAVGANGFSPTPSSCQGTGGAGGAGATSSITGSPVARAGGGGGGGVCGGGAGGTGGGGTGQGGNADGAPAQTGTANTGGGGGARGNPGSGGSGIVIIRYKRQ